MGMLEEYWQACGIEVDAEVLEIDRMEDAIAPLNEQTTQISALITAFSSCYHEADKEAERIIQAIGSGEPPVEEKERPPQRKRELQNSLEILLAWCEGDSAGCPDLDVGGIRADELFTYLGKRSPLKIWQVQRVIDKLRQVLDYSCSYHNMALNIDGSGQPIEIKAEEYYKDHLDFLNQTTAAIINCTLDGEKPDWMSLALGIDMLRPCNWNYVGNLVIIFKAIAGDLHPDKPFAPCCLNKRLTPLRDRLRVISHTLTTFCEGREVDKDVDSNILALLGAKTDTKHWLAASLEKMISMQQDF
ncbi:MAG: hypothetical protein ACYS6K_26125 [Planctomycetota bacterium]|jgi:hypothetical protein